MTTDLEQSRNENKDLGASAADAADRVGGPDGPEPRAASQPSGRSPHGAWTPGPWRWDGTSVLAGSYRLMHRWNGVGNSDEMAANARLISAAPTMFEALERALKEAEVANEAIRLNRDGGGSGRVKVATAMHHIEEICRAALSLALGDPR